MILTLNNFKFQDKNYKQIKGTAMGTRKAPSYANLFMGLLEENFLNSLSLKPLVWLRFIDDIFIIWHHGKEQLNDFLNKLQNFSILDVSWNISDKVITFLDVDIFLNNGNLGYKIHIKDTNKMQYLHYTSCHPLYMKKSIPKSLSLRAKRLCSSQHDFNNYLSTLSNALNEQGYPIKVTKTQINKYKKHKRNSFENSAKFITQYFPGLHRINGIIKSAYSVLENAGVTKDILKKPPRVIFRRPPNLQNILSKPKLPAEPVHRLKHGCEPCKKSRCALCKNISPGSSFTSSTTNISYPVNGQINCDTNNVIYQLKCNTCPKDYIGLTSNPLRLRINNHRATVKKKIKEQPVSAHALEHKQNFDQCFSIKGLKSIPVHPDPEYNMHLLRRAELAHQYVLKTRNPFGLNLR